MFVFDGGKAFTEKWMYFFNVSSLAWGQRMFLSFLFFLPNKRLLQALVIAPSY